MTTLGEICILSASPCLILKTDSYLLYSSSPTHCWFRPHRQHIVSINKTSCFFLPFRCHFSFFVVFLSFSSNANVQLRTRHGLLSPHDASLQPKWFSSPTLRPSAKRIATSLGSTSRHASNISSHRADCKMGVSPTSTKWLIKAFSYDANTASVKVIRHNFHTLVARFVRRCVQRAHHWSVRP